MGFGGDLDAEDYGLVPWQTHFIVALKEVKSRKPVLDRGCSTLGLHPWLHLALTLLLAPL